MLGNCVHFLFDVVDSSNFFTLFPWNRNNIKIKLFDQEMEKEHVLSQRVKADLRVMSIKKWSHTIRCSLVEHPPFLGGILLLCIFKDPLTELIYLICPAFFNFPVYCNCRETFKWLECNSLISPNVLREPAFVRLSAVEGDLRSFTSSRLSSSLGNFWNQFWTLRPNLGWYCDKQT